MHLTFTYRRRFVLLAVYSGILPALLQTQGTADELKPDELTAKQIVERMAQEYAKCKSYRDSGVVKIVYNAPDLKGTVDRPFTTAFVRPDRFRFEYKYYYFEHDKEYRRHIIWRKGNDVQTWWDVDPGIKKPKSLGLALRNATGVSGGSAYTVPPLLIPDEVAGSWLTDITEAQRIEDAQLDKVECFRIQGQHRGFPMTIWGEKKRFLVRRIDWQPKLVISGVDVAVEQTTIYEPVIDAEISDKMLEFDPPRRD